MRKQTVHAPTWLDRVGNRLALDVEIGYLVEHGDHLGALMQSEPSILGMQAGGLLEVACTPNRDGYEMSFPPPGVHRAELRFGGARLTAYVVSGPSWDRAQASAAASDERGYSTCGAAAVFD